MHKGAMHIGLCFNYNELLITGFHALYFIADTRDTKVTQKLLVLVE